MARQRIHNRRAGRGSTGSASWISYSDMMAALILIFVLILTYSLYQYFIMLKNKTDELEAQKQQLILIQDALDDRESALIILQTDLDAKQQELDEQNQKLIILQNDLDDKEKTLVIIQADLDAKQAELAAARARLEDQQLQLTTQAHRIDDLIGIRTTMIRDLSTSLARANLKATVDPNNGDIVLDSSVFFETGKSTIKPEGQELLNRFIPVYLDVLLRDKYADYLGEIIIEGHTDSLGTYEKNLELSQDRALAVALYCLRMPSLTSEQKAKLQQILTAKGRSYSDLIYDENGKEDADASRRVEFKFSLKDSEMIEEMNRILADTEQEE